MRPIGGEQAYFLSGDSRRVPFLLSATPVDTTSEVMCWGFPCQLGEGIHWCAADNSLYWVDIRKCRLHRFNLISRLHEQRSFPEPICWVFSDSQGHLLAGFARGVYFVDFNSGSRTLLHAMSQEPHHNRLNDAMVDLHGRLWFGTMDNLELQASGCLYRLTSQGPVVVDQGYKVSNGPVQSVDGRYLYHTSTSERMIYRFRMDSHGQILGKQPFIRFDEEMGYPDGMAMDSEGGLWVAQWGGSGICRFTADGKLDRRVELPVPLVTNLVFAGAKLDRLFVTTAYEGMSAQERILYPQAGSLFELDVGFCGLPTPAVQMDLQR